MHLLFSPNHVQLISACYPPSSALLTSGPDYRPNAQELSRLTYYASNRQGKVNKLGSELEKRAKAECRKAQAGNIRSRAALLITLAIFKALATECRRDMSLLSPSLINTLDACLTALPFDLEVCARVATVFTAWTTYTDGHLIGIDNNVTQSYLSTLHKFSMLSRVQSKNDDHEVRNRTRLIGLAALTGAVNSEALYNTSVHFKTQVSFIIRPILMTLLEVDVSVLNEQAVLLKESSPSPYLAEFRTRPPIERRALSIHLHVDGDNGPTTADVVHASLHTLSSLLEHSNGAQLGWIMQASFDSMDELNGWEKSEQCCWFAHKSCEWAQYQYRYAIPTRLVERLLESQDTSTSNSALHRVLTSMITTVFKSPTPLVNLSTSDIISNLITLLLRRVAADPEDPLLPALVECITSLGAHLYYSDQIQDLAGELISRLTLIEVQGVPSRNQSVSEKCRCQAIRCLLASLLGLMQVSDLPQEKSKEQECEIPIEQPRSPVLPSSPTFSDPESRTAGRSSQRTRISPEIWQETMTLLCDNEFAVRADYAEALVCYLRTEVPKLGDGTDSDGVKRIRPLSDGVVRQATNLNLVLYGDSTTRSLNAMHAYVYVLATTSTLGLYTGSTPSPARSTTGDNPPVNISPPTPADSHSSVGAEHQNSLVQSHSLNRRSMSLGPRTRKVSVVQRLLEHVPSKISASASASASDYSHILVVLTAVHEHLPVRGLLTGVPMLLALDGAANIEGCLDVATRKRLRAIKEVVARIWHVIGKVWDCAGLSELSETALTSLPEPSALLYVSHTEPGKLHSPREAIHFSAVDGPTEEQWSGVDAEAALMAIVSCQKAQEATGLDRQGLLRRFAHKWTPESALNELERPSGYDAGKFEGLSPFLKISPALMHIENMSLQSLARSTRGVGVTDLREALEGRSSMSNPALVKPPSISTLDHTSSITGDLAHRLSPIRSKPKKRPGTSAAPGEVRDVLNKLGIGKQNGNNLLKASFPALQRGEQKTPGVLASQRT